MSERRRFKRYDCALPAKVLERGAQRGFHSSDGLVTQISLLGCFVQTSRRPVESTEIGLQISSPQDSALTLRVFGSIAHVAQREAASRGFGVAFQTMSDTSRQDLIHFIDTLRKQDVLSTGSFRAVQATEAEAATFRLDVDTAAANDVDTVNMPGMRKQTHKS